MLEDAPPGINGAHVTERQLSGTLRPLTGGGGPPEPGQRQGPGSEHPHPSLPVAPGRARRAGFLPWTRTTRNAAAAGNRSFPCGVDTRGHLPPAPLQRMGSPGSSRREVCRRGAPVWPRAVPAPSRARPGGGGSNRPAFGAVFKADPGPAGADPQEAGSPSPGPQKGASGSRAPAAQKADEGSGGPRAVGHGVHLRLWERQTPAGGCSGPGGNLSLRRAEGGRKGSPVGSREQSRGPARAGSPWNVRFPPASIRDTDPGRPAEKPALPALAPPPSGNIPERVNSLFGSAGLPGTVQGGFRPDSWRKGSTAAGAGPTLLWRRDSPGGLP
jgi:hypothetical protein